MNTTNATKPPDDREDEGWLARVGVILPSINTVVEPWFSRAVPAGVAVHAARMYLAPKLSAEEIIAMDAGEGMAAVRQIASCRPKSIAYCCTASSIIQGQAYDERLRREIHESSHTPATTATHSILSALSAIGARRISLVSPYTDEVDAMEHAFFEAAGLEILSGAHLGISETFRLAEPSAAELIDLARRGWHADSDAMVMTCLNTRSHLVIDALEKELGKPVITSTQATLWHLLRLAGVANPVPGYGALLRAPQTAPA